MKQRTLIHTGIDLTKLDFRNPPPLKLRMPWYRYFARTVYTVKSEIMNARNALSDTSAPLNGLDHAALFYYRASVRESGKYPDNKLALQIHSISFSLKAAALSAATGDMDPSFFYRYAAYVVRRTGHAAILEPKLVEAITEFSCNQLSTLLGEKEFVRANTFATQVLMYAQMPETIDALPVVVSSERINAVFDTYIRLCMDKAEFLVIAELLNAMGRLGHTSIREFIASALTVARSSSTPPSKVAEAYEAVAEILPITDPMVCGSYDEAMRADPSQTERLSLRRTARLQDYAEKSSPPSPFDIDIRDLHRSSLPK